MNPRQTFEDNIRPADLMLKVYTLLDSNDQILTEGDLVEALKRTIEAAAEEDVMVIYNEIFLGMVRERAQMTRSTLRRAMLVNLLRQAIVATCTALETYLPALLRANLPTVIRVRGRDLVPVGDQPVLDYFEDLHFSLDELLRLLKDPNAEEYISGKILGLANFKYLSDRKGIHVVGSLLGLNKPWGLISERLNRDTKELISVLEDAVRRRNDIVHRADRPQTDPGGSQQDISYVWAKQAVDTVHYICLAIDDLVSERMAEYEAMLETAGP